MKRVRLYGICGRWQFVGENWDPIISLREIIKMLRFITKNMCGESNRVIKRQELQ